MKNLIYTLTLFAFGFYGCRSDSEEFEDTRRLVNADEFLNLKKTFDHEAGHAIRLWSDSKSIFISNAPDFSVYAYNYQGIFQRKFGKKGDSPSEMGTIWYFQIDSSQNCYWVHDYSKQLIKKYSLKTDSLIFYRKVITINNIVYAGQNRFIVPRLDEQNGSYLLSVYDVEKQTYIRDYDLLRLSKAEKLKSMKYIDFVFEGNFCTNDKTIVYYCRNNGLFFVIDKKTLELKIIDDVRHFPMPTPFVQNANIRLKPKIIGSLSATLDNNYLYSLTLHKNSDTRYTGKSQIDVYDLQTGKYVNSFEVKRLNGENRAMAISISDKSLLIQYENNTVGVYSFNDDVLTKIKQ